jgi:glycosyltransferase involved in cell wall biosynthesis
MLSIIKAVRKLLVPIDLSIIIPVYNTSHYLPECLNSIFTQIEANYEIIVIDDASTDGSDEILHDYKNRFDNFKLIKNIQNIGPGASRNIGISLSRGKYIAFIDSDDYLSGNYFMELLNAANKTEADIVFSGIDPSFPVFEEFVSKYVSDIDNLCDLPAECKMTGIIGKLFKSAFIKKNNLRFLDEHILVGEDIPFTWTSYFLANKIAFALNATYFYRLHGHGGDSIIDERVLGIFDALKYTKNIYEGLDPKRERKELFVSLLATHIFYNYSKLVNLSAPSEMLQIYLSAARNLLDLNSDDIGDNKFLTTEQKTFLLSVVNK